MKRRCYFDIRIEGEYSIFSLNFEPRLGEYAFKEKLRVVLSKIGNTFGYDSTFDKQKRGYVTHRQVGEQIEELRNWFKKKGIELRVH